MMISGNMLGAVPSPTCGHLKLEFIEAKLDHDTKLVRKMDPYCKIWMREEFYQT